MTIQSLKYFVKWLHCVQRKNEPSLSAIYAPPFFHFKKKEMSQWNYKGKKPCQHPLFNYYWVPNSGILFKKLFWPTVGKIVLVVREIPLKIWGWSQSYIYQVLQTLTLYCGTYNWLCVHKMLNHGLNHGVFLSLFKLISCPIHWIVCVLAYLNFIFEF